MIIFDIQVDPYRPKLQTNCSKLAAEDFRTSEFPQEMWDRNILLGFVSAHIPWNAISNLELRWWYKALRDDLVLPSATTLHNICRRGYALPVDAIKKQLQSRNIVALALDGWTSPKKRAITSVMGYYMHRNWALHDVQLSFDEVDCLFLSLFESELKIIGQGPTY